MQRDHVYMDYHATTPMAPEVMDTLNKAMVMAWGNPSSTHAMGRAARDVIAKARGQVAAMIGALPQEIVFTSGGTESNNWAVVSALLAYERWIKRDRTETRIPHVITTTVEHESTSKFLQHFEKQRRIDVTWVTLNQNGCLRWEDITAAIRPTTCLVTVMLVNNETGVVFPVPQIAAEIRKANEDRWRRGLFPILVHTDAAQAFGKISVDVSTMPVHYISIAGHKFYGPRMGALYARRLGSDAQLFPILRGGGQEGGYRPGTENTPLIAALGTAAHLVTMNLPTYHTHLTNMSNYLRQRLTADFGPTCVFNCEAQGTPRVPSVVSVSFMVPNLSGTELLRRCRKLLASTGSACNSGHQVSSILLRSGIPEVQAKGTLRLSVGRETTREDVDMCVADLRQAINSFLPTCSQPNGQPNCM